MFNNKVICVLKWSTAISTLLIFMLDDQSQSFLYYFGIEIFERTDITLDWLNQISNKRKSTFIWNIGLSSRIPEGKKCSLGSFLPRQALDTSVSGFTHHSLKALLLVKLTSQATQHFPTADPHSDDEEKELWVHTLNPAVGCYRLHFVFQNNSYIET